MSEQGEVMYVASYNTYIAPLNVSEQTEFKKTEKGRESSTFALETKPDAPFLKPSTLPVDYVAKNSGFWQKYELQRQMQEQQKQGEKFQDATQLFTRASTLQHAKEVYTHPLKTFSLYPKPHAKAIDQTPKIDERLSPQAHEFKELQMRRTMINTYVANDTYYKITA